MKLLWPPRSCVCVLVLSLALDASADKTSDQSEPDYGISPIDLSIFPPLNLIHFDKTKIVGASVGLLASGADAVHGVSLNGLGGYHADEMRGVMISGFMNFTGKTSGLIVSGLGNFVDSCPGVVMVSLFGNACGDFDKLRWPTDGFGVQLAAFQNTVYGDFAGVQFSLFENAVLGSGKILQVGGLNSGQTMIAGVTHSGNVSTYTVRRGKRLNAELIGLQLGIANSVIQSFSGVQLGLFANHVGKEMRGIQIGLWNYAGSLKGLQIGLINVADTGGLPFMPFVNLGF